MHHLARPSSCSNEELDRSIMRIWKKRYSWVHIRHAVAATLTRSWSDAITHGGEQQHYRQSKKDDASVPPHQPKRDRVRFAVLAAETTSRRGGGGALRARGRKATKRAVAPMLREARPG